MSPVAFDSPVGRLAFLMEGGVVTRLWLPEDEDFPEDAPAAEGSAEAELVRRLLAYFAGEDRLEGVPLAPPPGTPLQRRIWRDMAAIPYGARVTYGSLGPARVVGHVCATNPLPLLAPCHRVIPAHAPAGTFGAGRYRGGSALKRRLLDLEAASAASSARAEG